MTMLEWLPRGRARRSAELIDEVRAHLDMAEADRVARGESPRDAAANARREFGNLGLVHEVARDQWGRAGSWIEHGYQDVCFALRTLRRAPGFATVAILTIALGVGGTTCSVRASSSTSLRRGTTTTISPASRGRSGSVC